MKNKKVLIIIISLLVLVCIAFGLVIFFYVQNNKSITFKLLGEKSVTLNIGEEYKDSGYVLKVNKKNVKAKVSGEVNNKKIGTYKIEYSYIDKFKKKHKLFRTVKVLDKAAPVIELKGNNEMDIILNEEFNDPGYTVLDNYDKEKDIKVTVTGEVDSSEIGSYEIVYVAVDTSGNKSSEVKRIVNVNKPKPVVVFTEVKIQEKETSVVNIVNGNTNTITSNSFNNNGISYEGYLKGNNGNVLLRLKNDSNSYDFTMNVNGDYYNGDITFEGISNGDYKVYVVSGEEFPLDNKMEIINRIVRSKIGNKLVSLNYDDGVTISVSDFAYQYDILIDVGHGGSDNGASNQYSYEKNMNLTQSLYEKCRYEEMGLKVLLTRTNDTYGNAMGPTSWNVLTQRAYWMGYYGVVSKVVYSNHHNSTSNGNAKGYEILTPAQFDSLEPELNIKNSFNNYYPYTGRLYARDYEGGGIYSSNNGERYNFKNYYCVIRVPYELFNKKVVIYEGAYLSNLSDYNWYWTEGNWKGASEIKIKEYVTSIGGTYTSSTSCS